MQLLSNGYYMGKYYLFTEDEIAYYDTLEPTRQKNLSFQELLEIFPGNKGVVEKKLRGEISQYNEDLIEAAEIRRDTNSIIETLARPQNDEWWKCVAYEFFIKPLEKDREKMIKKNYFELSLLKRKVDTEKAEGKIGPIEIERAKSVPIATFIEIGRDKKALCIFHNDHVPSLHVYPNNRFFCFVCGQSGDSVDIVMKLRGIGFLEAVKSLI